MLIRLQYTQRVGRAWPRRRLRLERNLNDCSDVILRIVHGHGLPAAKRGSTRRIESCCVDGAVADRDDGGGDCDCGVKALQRERMSGVCLHEQMLYGTT